MHSKWRGGVWSDLRGRVADLKAAYKQLPRFPGHAACSVISVYDPESKSMRLFEAISMMFGETAAVYAFLRFSRALSAIFSKIFGMCVTEYFDDFTQVEPAATAESALETIEAVIDLLGWQLSKGEEKRRPFEKEFVALGVTVDLCAAMDAVVKLKNKPGRAEKTSWAIGQAKASGLDDRVALSIRGKIRFAEGQWFARVAAPAMYLLSQWAKERYWRKPTPELVVGLDLIEGFMVTAGPRVVGPLDTRPPILIFTDGACEDITTVGGVLFEPGRRSEFFSSLVPESVVASWKSRLDQEQVIGQAELYPVILAKKTWKERLHGRSVIFFLDNEAARLGLVKAYSPVLASLKLISESVQLDVAIACRPWYARVPTVANISDGPSRLDPSEVKRLYGAVEVPVVA